ncbi:hypothetical protein PO909_007439 [Leuciscus waleckii]
MAGIIPRRKIKGVDFCGLSYYYYIIRSDLGCYMRASNFNKGSDLSIHALHPACRNGDHYLSGFGWFYIIFQGKGTYRKTTDLSKDSRSDEYPLHPNCRDGLYYWGLPDHYYFLKPASKWGVQYYKGTNFNKDECTAVYSVHPDVLNFLPGGLSITNGPAFGKWVNIKSVDNDSPTPVSFLKKVTKKVGYNKEKLSQITHNWRIETSGSITSGKLEGLISQYQFSFTAEYGGSSVNAEKENWNEETVVEEQITFDLKPNERLYVWQYQLGLGSEPVLFCKDLKITNKTNPPTEVPLPPA